jgi:hypothetical protein
MSAKGPKAAVSTCPDAERLIAAASFSRTFSSFSVRLIFADNLGEVSAKPLHVTARGPQEPCIA